VESLIKIENLTTWGGISSLFDGVESKRVSPECESGKHTLYSVGYTDAFKT